MLKNNVRNRGRYLKLGEQNVIKMVQVRRRHNLILGKCSRRIWFAVRSMDLPGSLRHSVSHRHDRTDN